jgi:lipopolysaccharide/colanic/teichoic acid biosynthesis glycosyltransferase
VPGRERINVAGHAYLRHGTATLAVKRVFDIAVALAGLVVSAPLFGVIAILIKLDSAGPVFFRQTRVGLQRRRFQMWKFRKMYADLPRQGPLLTARHDARMTRLGRFLERTKLDELPQLLNVLRGDMSVIGPRPEVEKFVDYYQYRWDDVLSVKPGIFGVNQIRYRNESELYPSDCADLERFYVERLLLNKLKQDGRYAHETLLARDLWLLLHGVWVSVMGTVTRRTFSRVRRRARLIAVPRRTTGLGSSV